MAYRMICRFAGGVAFRRSSPRLRTPASGPDCGLNTRPNASSAPIMATFAFCRGPSYASCSRLLWKVK